jgi:hypothetical protein
MRAPAGLRRLSFVGVPWPAAEVQITEALVRELLTAQHPDLADGRLRLVDAGFDNELWRLGDDLAVRVPRRAAAAALLENEQRWLPRLARRLPLPIPVPVRIGQPTRQYRWLWSVVPWLAGEPGDRVPVADAADTGGRLGRFLAALHRAAPRSAPFNPWRSIRLSDRADVFAARLSVLRTDGERRQLRKVWQLATEAGGHPGPPVWIHGDLHPTIELTGVALKATYTVTVLHGAPHQAGGEAFTSYLLGPAGQLSLTRSGFELVKPPAVTGSGVPAGVSLDASG